MRGLVPPSSAPCSPAPSRVLVIVRTDSQPIMTPLKTNFEKPQTPAVVTQSSPYQNHSSVLNTIPSADAPSPSKQKRWSLFRGLNGLNGLNVFNAPGNSRPGEVTPPGSPHERVATLVSDTPGPNSAITAPKKPASPPHQAFSFKFSLEYFAPRPNLENKNRTVTAPVLPSPAQHLLSARQSSESSGSMISGSGSGSGGSGVSDGSEMSGSTPPRTRLRPKGVKPLKPKEHEMGTARYSGRALAEWTQVLHECRSFYLRRKQEGVPRDSLIETPTMGVENFRMMSG